MTARRSFIRGLGIAILVAPVAIEAEQASKAARVAVLSPGPSPASPAPVFEAFRQGLRELGYVEGENLVIEWKFAAGDVERLRELAAELVQLNVDVIVPINIIPLTFYVVERLGGPIRFPKAAECSASFGLCLTRPRYHRHRSDRAQG